MSLLPLWTHLDRGVVLGLLIATLVGLSAFWTVYAFPNRDDDAAWKVTRR